jgi:hypothetical protein
MNIHRFFFDQQKIFLLSGDLFTAFLDLFTASHEYGANILVKQ